MPRGEHPNSRANLAKGHPFDEETARKAKKKSDEAKAVYRSLNADLRDQCDEETIKKINKKIIEKAKNGNLKAYELLRDGLGEKPKERIDISTREEDMKVMDGILEQLGMTDA